MRSLKKMQFPTIIFLVLIFTVFIATSYTLACKILSERGNEVTGIAGNEQQVNRESNIDVEVNPIVRTVENLSGKLSALTTTIESSLNNYLIFSEYMMFLSVKTNLVESSYILDNNDVVHKLVEEPKDYSVAVNTIAELDAFCKENSINFLYVFPPDREIDGFTHFPKGTVDYSKRITKSVNEELTTIGVETLYLNNMVSTFDGEVSDIHYKTDHHWSIEACLWAYANTVQWLESLNICIDTRTINPSMYVYESYENGYLGSYGEKLSPLYAGYDDFTFIYPEYDTDFQLIQLINGNVLHERNGRFEETLIYDDLKDYNNGYSTNFYGTYLGYGNAEKRIINKKINNGLKVLVLGDSFSRPYATFMSLGVSELYNVDTQPGRFSRNIYSYIEEISPDIVICLYSNENLYNPNTFNYKKEE